MDFEGRTSNKAELRNVDGVLTCNDGNWVERR